MHMSVYLEYLRSGTMLKKALLSGNVGKEIHILAVRLLALGFRL